MDLSKLPAIIGWPVYLALCVLIGYWNKSKGHNFGTGLAISFFLTPIFGFIMVLVTKKKESFIQ